MRILALVSVFLPHIGGVERHVYNVGRELTARDHQVTIITTQHRADLAEHEVMDGMDVWRMSISGAEGNTRLAIWSWLWRHRDLIAEANVVHCHDSGTLIAWYLPFRFIYFAKPVYLTFHGFEEFPLRRKTIWFRKLAERLAWGNICIGHYIGKWYGTKPSFVIYGGVDLPIEASNQPVKSDAIFVGRLEEDTGVLEYLDAMRIVKAKHGINLKLELCGDGALRAEIQRRVIQSGLDVNLHGSVENPQDYLRRGRYAFVSGYLAILEAMINKRLVFAIYSNPLKRDYLLMMPGAESMMVVAGSAEELAEKLAYYRWHPEQTAWLIENAYQWAKEQTWAKVADTYLALYKRKGDG